MRVLLDTHVFLWWLYESSRLSARVRELLADGSNTLLFSSASVWELIIKIQSGKLRIPEEPEAFIVGRLALHSMDSLSVKLEHAVRVYTLPAHHKDNARMVFQKIPFADHNAMLDPATVDITGRVLECLAAYGYSMKDEP